MEFVDAAFENAYEALARGEVPVGCVFVYKSEIIAKGSNKVNETKNATMHAEVVCCKIVLDYCHDHELDYKDVFKEIIVVVTVEPCIMCAAFLIDMNVKEIIYGCKNDRFGGSTVVNAYELYKSDIKLTGGIRAEEAMQLLKKFYENENPSAPVPNKKRKKANQSKEDTPGTSTQQTAEENTPETPKEDTPIPGTSKENL